MQKLPTLCNKYSVLHKKVCFCAIGVKKRIGERILLYTKDYQKDEVITCLPVYFIPYL